MVDDESSVREAMRGLLQEEGWAVEVYSSGEAFLEAYRPGREGCLVVDARMPRMSGLELLERLKTEGGGPPAIMITGHADIRLAVRAMKAGAMAFLEKPVQYDELVVNIERALELTRNSAALSVLARGGCEADRRPDLARAPGRRNGRRRQSEQADRLRPRHQPKDRRDPSRHRHEEDRRADTFRADSPDNRRLAARPVKTAIN